MRFTYMRDRGRHGTSRTDSFQVALFACLFLVTACTRSAAPSPLLGGYAFAPPPLHMPTGTLIFSERQFPETANPLFASTSADFELDAALWAQPVFYDQYFHVHPDQLSEVPLPENGDVLDNGKTVIMRLRHNLHWSDGQPILASDFVYWWHLNQDPNTGATLSGGYDQIATMETPDAFTIVLHMKHPYGPYLSYLPLAAPQHAWSSLHPIDLQNTASVYQAPQVTSGPYKLLRFIDGQRYVLVPNIHYVSTTFHGPFIAQLLYQAVPDMSTQHTDVAMGFMENDLTQLAHLPASMQVVSAPAAAYEHLDFNLAQPLFQDVSVRRAIQMAIDVCGMLKTVLHEPDCSRRATQVEPPPSLFFDASIQPVTYSSDAARKLLAQAGWTTDTHGLLMKFGRPFIIRLVTTAHNALRLATATYIQRALLAIGIQVQVSTYELGKFFGVYTTGGVLAIGAYDMSLFTYADGPEPDDEYDVFHSSQIPSADQPDLGNYGRVNDVIIDQALTQGRTTISFAGRVISYHRFLERLAQQVYVIPLYTERAILITDRHVENILPNPNLAAPDWNIADWWIS